MLRRWGAEALPEAEAGWGGGALLTVDAGVGALLAGAGVGALLGRAGAAVFEKSGRLSGKLMSAELGHLSVSTTPTAVYFKNTHSMLIFSVSFVTRTAHAGAGQRKGEISTRTYYRTYYIRTYVR